VAVFIGSVGLTINFSIGIDISAPGVLTIRVQKPDRQITHWTPTLDNAVAGTCHYTTLADDIDQYGTWKAQAKWQPNGVGDDDILWGTEAEFEVLPLI